MPASQPTIEEFERKINDENLGFYQKIEIERFSEFAKIIGLETGVDIDEIYEIIKKDKVLVEIGAGYGRAIQALLKKGFKERVYAVERVNHLVNYMRHLFVEQENVKLILKDVKYLKLPEKADTILWVWSGILELSLKEQEEALLQLKEQLKPHGKIIIETPYQDVKFIGKKSTDNYIRFETDWGKIEAYLSTFQDIKLMSEKVCFNKLEKKLYKTNKDLTRVFYILS